jgi:hypothetical protein
LYQNAKVQKFSFQSTLHWIASRATYKWKKRKYQNVSGGGTAKYRTWYGDGMEQTQNTKRNDISYFSFKMKDILII